MWQENRVIRNRNNKVSKRGWLVHGFRSHIAPVQPISPPTTMATCLPLRFSNRVAKHPTQHSVGC